MQTFYMMVGIPGSGKSFFAERVHNAVVHSSDAIRAEVLGDENDQTKQELVFQTLHERVFRDLADGKNVVYDATNINYKRRMAFLQQINAMRIPSLWTVCVFMAVPYETCIERNNNRERSVPEAVIHKMYKKFDIPMKAEGWDEILVVDSEDRFDRLNDLLTRLSKLDHDNPHHEYTVGLQHSNISLPIIKISIFACHAPLFFTILGKNGQRYSMMQKAILRKLPTIINMSAWVLMKVLATPAISVWSRG